MVPRRGLVALAALIAVAVPAPVNAASPDCEADAAWSSPVPEKAGEIFGLVNVHRTSLGLPALLFSPTLGDSASWKSMHMAGFEYFSHEDPAPFDRTWQERVRDCGYLGGMGENIQFGSDSPLVTLERWLASPVHRANIENPTFTVVGVGVARSASGAYYWTQNFGTEIDAGSSLFPPGIDPGEDGALESPQTGDADLGAVIPGEENTNHEPVAGADASRARRSRWIKVRVLGNDFDVDGDALRIEQITARPTKGRVRINDAHTFIRYRARGGVTGRDRLSYSISDGHGGFATALVRVRVRR